MKFHFLYRNGFWILTLCNHDSIANAYHWKFNKNYVIILIEINFIWSVIEKDLIEERLRTLLCQNVSSFMHFSRVRVMFMTKGREILWKYRTYIFT